MNRHERGRNRTGMSAKHTYCLPAQAQPLDCQRVRAMQSLHAGANMRLRTAGCRCRASSAPRPQQRQLQQRRVGSSRAARRRCGLRVVAHLDYVATASDEGVLKLPSRTELDIEEVKNVFDYPRQGQHSP